MKAYPISSYVYNNVYNNEFCPISDARDDELGWSMDKISVQSNIRFVYKAVPLSLIRENIVKSIDMIRFAEYQRYAIFDKVSANKSRCCDPISWFEGRVF